MSSKRKILFPTRIALILVMPALILYLFFNTWPMIFSIGIAFTDATQKNISPSPEAIDNWENAIRCAIDLRDKPEYKEKASGLVNSTVSSLMDVYGNLTGIKNYIEAGGDFLNTPLSYLRGLDRSVRTLMRVSEEFKMYFNCTELGYPTSISPISKEMLEKFDALSTLSGRLQNPGAYDNKTYYNEVVTGYNITIELVNYFKRLETDYEGYMNEFIASAQNELDSLQLKFIGLENFKKLFYDPRFYNSLYKTMLFVATSVPLKVGFGVLLALFYSSELLRGRRIMRALIIVPWAMPFLLSALTWKFLFIPNGQLGQLLGLNMNNREWDAFLVYNLFETWLAYPFIMTITQGALGGVPKEVIEASYIDGANAFTRLRKVIFPLIKKPVLVASISTTGASLQAFLVPLTLNGAGPTGYICAPFVGCTAGYMNEMLIVFGYYRVIIDQEYGYAASVYLVILAIILVYVTLWLKLLMEKGGK
ncbi:carbohydrate ABC transporter permease [Desulfurococcus amylolyticus]|mgnify:CR=1 FL=1|uniref:carbohydrate ABC transporter permease n=1 Tax=Desulfurococcus amylolyticus TaxID=94694 RepID=UPI0023F4F66C|nr:sugar ABC transporter permease [Desulfurococcus amylolyticus]